MAITVADCDDLDSDDEGKAAIYLFTTASRIFM